MPECSVCGQAEHRPIDGVLDHCRTCRQPVYAGTSYWIWRRASHLVDYYYCLDCITWSRSADELVARASNMFGKRGRR